MTLIHSSQWVVTLFFSYTVSLKSLLKQYSIANCTLTERLIGFCNFYYWQQKKPFLMSFQSILALFRIKMQFI